MNNVPGKQCSWMRGEAPHSQRIIYIGTVSMFGWVGSIEGKSCTVQGWWDFFLEAGFHLAQELTPFPRGLLLSSHCHILKTDSKSCRLCLCLSLGKDFKRSVAYHSKTCLIEEFLSFYAQPLMPHNFHLPSFNHCIVHWLQCTLLHNTSTLFTLNWPDIRGARGLQSMLYHFHFLHTGQGHIRSLCITSKTKRSSHRSHFFWLATRHPIDPSMEIIKCHFNIWYLDDFLVKDKPSRLT